MPDRRQLNRLPRPFLGFVALFVAVGAWLLSIGGGDREPPILPDTDVQFSLDLEVVASTDADPVYIVEQRARPRYRIFEFDPRTGEVTTVFTVPEDAVIYGISLSPDRTTMAVAYTPDFELDGSGMWLLDLESGSLTVATEVVPDLYLTEPEWSSDGSEVLVTQVDRRRADEDLALAVVDVETGAVDIVNDDAITPAVAGDALCYLTLDDENARRSIGCDTDGDITEIEVFGGEVDLDHLVAATSTGEMRVAVLEAPDEPALTVGAQADAHGNHNVRSAWWDVASGGGVPVGAEPIIVYDAVRTDAAITWSVTLEGLSATDGERTDLIESRALRFITG